MSAAARHAFGLFILGSALALAACGEEEGNEPTPPPAPVPLGDVRFEAVRLPTEAAAGHSFPVHAEVIADSEKHNVTLLLRLIESSGVDPASVDLTATTHDQRVWSTVIEHLSPGVAVTVDETVDLPGTLAPGDYAAVLQLNVVDFTAADDLLQGEEAADEENNTFIAPTALHLTRPAAPDLQIESLELNLHHFALPESEAFEPTNELLSANLVVESKTLPAEGAFAVHFELALPDGAGGTQWLPLLLGAADAAGAYAGPLDSYTFSPREHLLPDGTTLTAALPANQEAGFHVGLFPSTEARAALAALTEETDCEIRVTLDRAGVVAEHAEDNNARSVWARFYPGGVDLDEFEPTDLPEAAGLEEFGSLAQPLQAAGPTLPTPGVPAENPLYEKEDYRSFGNDDVDAYYVLDSTISYATTGNAPIGSGDSFYLYGADGKAASAFGSGLYGSTTATRLTLKALTGGGYQILRSPTTMLSICRSFFFGPRFGSLSWGSAQFSTSPSCTAFQLEDLNGGTLENGDPIYLRAPDGAYIGPTYNGIYDRVRSPGPQIQLTIKKADTDPGSARNVRFSSDDYTSITVLGRGYTPLRARAVAGLDLDVPANNRFACDVETFDVTVLQKAVSFPTDGTGTVVLYDRETELYSKSVSKEKKFVLGGVVPITVKLTARGELGLRGRVTAGPTRKLTAGLGPYVDVTGNADAKVDYKVASAGVGIDLRFLKVTQLYNASLVLTDQNDKNFVLGGQLILQTLDGDLYVYANLAVGCGTLGLQACHWKKYVIDWNGYSKTYAWPPPKTFAWSPVPPEVN